MKNKTAITLGLGATILLVAQFTQHYTPSRKPLASTYIKPFIPSHIQSNIHPTQIAEPLLDYDQYVIDSKPTFTQDDFSMSLPFTQTTRYVVYPGIEDDSTDTVNQSIDVCDGPLQRDGSIVDKLTHRVFIPVVNPLTNKNHYVPKDLFEKFGDKPFEYSKSHEFIYNYHFSPTPSTK